MKRRITNVLVLVVALAGARTAGAQPGTGPVPTDPAPTGDPAPVDDPAPVTDPAPVPDPAGTRVVEPGHGRARLRPDGFAVAIGLGYDLPADLQAPNTTSVRFRLGSGLTFEPSVTFGRSTSSMESGGMTTTESKELEVTVTTLVRYPLHRNGRIDFELLGGAGLSIVSQFPDGSDNDIRTTTIGVSWGLGLGYWISQHWQLSLSALNPLLAFSRRTVQTGPDTDTTTSSTTMAASFDPNVIGMVHLYW